MVTDPPQSTDTRRVVQERTEQKKPLLILQTTDLIGADTWQYCLPN